MEIGILALQGAFIEHSKILKKLGANTFEIRQKKDLERKIDGLILPGGESTTQGKLLIELGILEPLKNKIKAGLPVLATCSGMILLAQNIGEAKPHLATLPVTVKRNAYGRQLGSFSTTSKVDEIGTIPMIFIRAPYIEQASAQVKILSKIDDKIVAVRYKNQLALSFHPELTDNHLTHKYFLNMISGTSLA